MAGKAEAVYSQLRHEIETMALAPGTRLGEIATAERLGASRTPVREALRRLASDGLVDLGRGEAARVSSVDIGQVHALFDFRQLIEAHAASLVAARIARGDQDATDEFGQIMAALRVDEDATDAAAFYALAERFDASVRRFADNAYLVRSMAELRSQTTRMRTLSHAGPQRRSASRSEHLALCEAILAGDPDAAAEAMRTHLDATRQALLDSVIRQPSPVGLVTTH